MKSEREIQTQIDILETYENAEEDAYLDEEQQIELRVLLWVLDQGEL